MSALAASLGLKRGADGCFRGTCPSCNYGKTFTLAEEHEGKPATAWCAVCRDEHGLQRVLSGLGADAVEVRPQTSDNTKAALKIWSEAKAAADSVVERYLRGRKIALELPADVRLVADLLHGPTGLRTPAMVAAVRDVSGNVVAVHRTYLSEDGHKADFGDEPSKMTLGPIGGCAVRLASPGPVLWIAEGIETALSVMQLTGKPCWAGISCGGIRQFQLPLDAGVQRVCIAADGDKAGRDAARAAVKQFTRTGIDARFYVAPEGQDFNDVLIAGAAS
jgi:phage/plasmid primase-like uncharacterized protein